MAILQQNKWLLGVISAALISSVAMWEGKRNVPYRDLANVLTVCYGYIGSDIQNRPYSNEECNILLRKEVVIHAEGVLGCVKEPMKENEFNAFVLMAYNVGVNGFCNSQTVKVFNAGHNEQACRLIAYRPNGTPNWSYVNGKFVQGLFNRRLYEMKMCLGE